MSDTLDVHLIRGTHKAVPLSDLERLRRIDPGELLEELGRTEGIKESLVLSTCHRFEIYFVSDDPSLHGEVFTLLSRRLPEGLPQGMEFLSGRRAIEHLFLVSSGLDSLVVGEQEVLRQVKEAFDLARRKGTLGPHLRKAGVRALRVGKLVRWKTGISRGSLSWASLAVECAERWVGPLSLRRVGVLGSGRVARLLGRHLFSRSVRAEFFSRNPTAESRKAIASFGGNLRPLEELRSVLDHLDVLFTASSSPHPLLGREDLEGRTSPLLILDLGNPRNVEEGVGDLPTITRLDLEGLKEISEENLRSRLAEAQKAEEIVREEVERFFLEESQRESRPISVSLRVEIDRIVEEETAIAFRKISLEEKEKTVVRNLVRNALKRALREPLRVLEESKDDEKKEEILRLLGVQRRIPLMEIREGGRRSPPSD